MKLVRTREVNKEEKIMTINNAIRNWVLEEELIVAMINMKQERDTKKLLISNKKEDITLSN